MTKRELKESIRRLEQRVDALEQLRPHWAQGFTSDSLAAQATAVALAQFWEAMKADNQTQAMSRLRELLSNQS